VNMGCSHLSGEDCDEAEINFFYYWLPGQKVKPKRLTEVVRDRFSLSFDFALFFFFFFFPLKRPSE